MGERTTTSDLQGCFHHPYLQTESKPIGMWQSPRNLLTFNFGQDPSKSSSKLPQQPSRTWTLTGELMWLPLGMWSCWHGVCCKTATRIVSGTEHWPLLGMLIWPRHLMRSAEIAFEESWQNMATPKNSSSLLGNFMAACMQGCKTTEKVQ